MGDLFEMKELTLLVDYRRTFYSSITHAKTICSMNVERLKNKFTNFGVNIDVLEFADVNLNDDWAVRIVLYQSSEDLQLQYKSYIEDMVLGLSLAGAHLVSGYP